MRLFLYSSAVLRTQHIIVLVYLALYFLETAMRTWLVVAVVICIAIAIGIAIFILQRSAGTEFVAPAEIQQLISKAPNVIKVSSPAFGNGQKIPAEYTCDGADVSPPLTIENVPLEAKSVLLVMYDPDTPAGTFYHWILFDIKPRTRIELPKNIPKTAETPYGIQGINDFRRVGYGGPCPPPGHGTHRYVFLVLALDTELPKVPNLVARAILEMAQDHVVAYGYLIGLYSR